MVKIIFNFAIFFLPDVYIRTVIFIFNLRILEKKISIIFALLKLMKIYAMTGDVIKLLIFSNLMAFCI